MGILAEREEDILGDFWDPIFDCDFGVLVRKYKGKYKFSSLGFFYQLIVIYQRPEKGSISSQFIRYDKGGRDRGRCSRASN